MATQVALQILPPKEKETPKPFAAALAATAKAETGKKKKDSIPVVTPPEEVRAAVDEYLDGKQEKNRGEARMETAFPTIHEWTVNQMDGDAYGGHFHGSYRLQGNQATARVTYANKFTINPEDAQQLMDLLGEAFPQLIKTNFSVKLKAEVFTDEALQHELMALVGDRFADFFETTTALTVTEEFNRNVYHFLQPEELADLRVFCRQYKPTIV